MIKHKFILLLILVILFVFLDSNSKDQSIYQHGIAMHGDLKYKKGFSKFDYASENAFKGGEIKLSSIGTFDNLNYRTSN